MSWAPVHASSVWHMPPFWFERWKSPTVYWRFTWSMALNNCACVTCEETISHHQNLSRAAEITHRDSTAEHCSRLEYKETLFNSSARCCKAFPCLGSGLVLGQLPFYHLPCNSQQSPAERLQKGTWFPSRQDVSYICIITYATSAELPYPFCHEAANRAYQECKCWLQITVNSACINTCLWYPPMGSMMPCGTSVFFLC